LNQRAFVLRDLAAVWMGFIRENEGWQTEKPKCDPPKPNLGLKTTSHVDPHEPHRLMQT
jgi:hypothetical protein